MRVLFYAPMKAHDHPDPSGDREMARLLLAALERAGCDVEIASRLRMHDRSGDAGLTRALATQARSEAAALVARIRGRPPQDRPQAFFTYHVHYKAPDVIGPAVSAALGIPYIIAEGSRAPKRADGPWAEGHRLAEAALDAAQCILVLNERDREVLERLARPGQRLVSLPPFIDADAWPDLRDRRTARAANGPVRLLTVAMMRDGDKLASYRMLADALARLPHALRWTLDIVGDGPAAENVHDAFGQFSNNINWCNRIGQRSLLSELYARADLLIWPAVNEAYGMIFLEAALQGCPSLAGRFGGVPGVVLDGVSGILTPGGDAEAFSRQLARLIAQPGELASLGRGAAAFVRTQRTLPIAAETLRTVLADLAARRGIAVE
jgi:glycosyltransferase involved in cell wall biosynthesis